MSTVHASSPPPTLPPPSEYNDNYSSQKPYSSNECDRPFDFPTFPTLNQFNSYAPPSHQERFYRHHENTIRNNEFYNFPTPQIHWNTSSPPPPPFMSNKTVPLLETPPRRLFKRCQSDEWADTLADLEQEPPTSCHVPFADVFENEESEYHEIHRRTTSVLSMEEENASLCPSVAADNTIVPAAVSVKAEIQAPRDIDVVCGRGVPTNRHPGNKSFRCLVHSRKEEYVVSTKKQKMAISRSVVDEIRRDGGRFLERDFSTGLWFEIVDKKALEKTSQALRDVAAPLRKQMSQDLSFARVFCQFTQHTHKRAWSSWTSSSRDTMQPSKRQRRHNMDDDEEMSPRGPQGFGDIAPPSPVPIGSAFSPLPRRFDVDDCDVYRRSSSFVGHMEEEFLQEEAAMAIKPVRDSQHSPSSVFAFPVDPYRSLSTSSTSSFQVSV